MGDDDGPPADLATRVTDHVAGMTDRFALRRFEELLHAARPGGAVSGRLTPASLEEVRERSDIVELVRADTELRKAGAEWIGRCPFHSERTRVVLRQPGQEGLPLLRLRRGRRRHRLRARSGTHSTSSAAVEWLAERFSVPLEYEEAEPRGRGAAARRGSQARAAGADRGLLPPRPAREPAGRGRPRVPRRSAASRGRWPSASSSASRPTSTPSSQARASGGSPIASSRRPASRGAAARGRSTA